MYVANANHETMNASVSTPSAAQALAIEPAAVVTLPARRPGSARWCARTWWSLLSTDWRHLLCASP